MDVFDYAVYKAQAGEASEGIVPVGTIRITENQQGLDISQYAEADVEVSANVAGWVLDNPDANGMPKRARFFPASGATDAGNNVFKKYSYDVDSVLMALKEIEFMPGTTRIGDNMVYNCPKIISITIPEGVTVLGAQAFEYTLVERLVLPLTLKTAGNYFCRNCAELNYIDFGGVTQIGYYLFGGSKLKTCICRGDVMSVLDPRFPNTMELYDFSHCTSVPTLLTLATIGYGAGTVIRIPSALYDAWTSATNWCDLPTDTTAERYVVWEGV